MSRARTILPLVVLGICTLSQAQVIYTGTTTDDSFLATGSPGNPNGADLTADNFGMAGVLAIASAASTNGEFQTVLKFDLSSATSLFSQTFGTNWAISAVSLDFASNVAQGMSSDNPIFNPVSSGKFVIEWLAADDWVEGTGRPKFPGTDGVTFDSLTNLLAQAHEILCTNTYTPPDINVHLPWPLPLNRDLVNDIAAGGPVSFRLFAGDDQISYLFNSHNFGNGNQPQIHVTAIPLLKILSAFLTNGTFHLNGLGQINTTYNIQACTNISQPNWQPIGTATASDGGMIEFDDATASGQTQQFYRLSQ